MHRRRFLQRTGSLLALGLVPSLSACSGEGDSRREPRPDPQDAASGPPGGAPGAAAPDPCADLSGLTPAQIDFRDGAGYVAETPDPGQRCDNCAFWTKPEPGASCGGCTLMEGPFHPGGYCDLWEAQG